jgi:hypothetical protein
MVLLMKKPIKKSRKKMKQSIMDGIENYKMMDLTDVASIDIAIRRDGNTLWINTPHGCVFRACRIGRIIIYDERQMEIPDTIVDPMRKKAK